MVDQKSSHLNSPQNIKDRAVKSIKWSVLAEIISKTLPLFVTVILARILVPADFGIIAAAMVFVSLAQLFQDFGLGKALIQQEGNIKQSANIVFWSNIVLSIFLYLIIFAAAPLIANFFHEFKVVNILRVLCLQIIFIGFGSVHLALLQREFQFQKIFFSGLGPAFIPGIVSIPLALMGQGVWALVWGTLAGAFSRVLILWKVSKWRPGINFDISLAKKLLSFGGWVLIELFFAWLIVQGEFIAIGHFLNINDLGVYHIGTTLVMLIFGTVFNPLLPILYSSFSRLQSQLSELKQSFLKVVRLVAAFSLPIGVGLAILSKSISSVIFGNKWQGIEIVILILGVTYAVSWLVGINHGVYRAIGRPDANSKILWVCVIFYIPVYILAAPHGLLAFCLARLGLEMIYIFLHFFVANKLLRLPFFYLWNSIKLPLIALLPMVVIVYGIINLISFQGWQGLFKLGGAVIMGGMSYIIVLYFLDKDFFIQSIALVKKAIKR